MSTEHWIDTHRLTLLRNGTAFFPALCADIAAAERAVDLHTYIFADDATGRMVAAALCRAAERGVAVRVLLDGFGSAGLSAKWVAQWQAAGVEVQWFRREGVRFRLRRHRLRRLHRKLAVIDGRVAYVGGINIIDDIPAGTDLAAPRLDFAVRVEGELAREAQAVMWRLWELVSWAAFRKRVRNLGWRLLRIRERGSDRLRLLWRDNLRHRHDIEHAYLKAIGTARHEILLANAYFLPGRRFRRALRAARRRGVKVTLLLQGRVEYWLQHYATLALYDDLLACGIELVEYEPSFLHAKVAVIDGEWATVGSSNIDPFSLWLAYEANLEVRDRGFAGQLRACLLHEIQQGGRKVDALHWRRSNPLWQFLRMASYGLIRMAVGLLGPVRGRDDL